jgi:agmatine/peptidylarginine deiminase
MKFITSFLFLVGFLSFSQDLPIWETAEEKALRLRMLENDELFHAKAMGIPNPPPFPNLRNAAEWEEVESLIITWTSYTSILREIIKAAQTECKITIICSDSNAVKSNLVSNNVPLTNLRFVITGFNSVWCRDYSANNVYGNYVDTLCLADWIYNRPTRPLDNATPNAIGAHWNLNVYDMTQSPNDLIHTGGNYMSDGWGTGFSSHLVTQENPSKTNAQIDTIMKKFMGIKRYIKMTVLPYDGIHHIDMHMKLLDEETLLVGQYPTGIADGPQIEANILYIQNNFLSVFGTPYKIVRIPMPMDKNGKWPHQSGGWYCTYTNGVFANKTFIFPTYYTQYDTTAFRIYKQNLPGYKLVGIDCDNGTSPIISAGGAIHCITHCVHSKNPLLISTQRLETQCDTGAYKIKARIMNKSGIAWAKVYYTTDTLLGFQQVNMALTDPVNKVYEAFIPSQQANKTVYYYIEAQSNNGKIQRRPMTAPLGRYTFTISPCGGPTGLNEVFHDARMDKIFPNPASYITCIPFTLAHADQVRIELRDINGKLVKVLEEKNRHAGDNKAFFFANELEKGIYFVYLISPKNGNFVEKVIVK